MNRFATLDGHLFSTQPQIAADALREASVLWIADWPPQEMCASLRDDLSHLQSQGGLRAAAVGRSDGSRTREGRIQPSIRGDSTCWLDDPRCGPVAREFLTQLDTFRITLNHQLFLGLGEVEAHYAAYPPNSGYQRHRDRFDGNTNDGNARMLSWVTYLNLDWDTHDGGQLQLYLDNHEAQTTITLPPSGGSVCFLSELEHEVLPTTRERFSVTAWFRRGTRV